MVLPTKSCSNARPTQSILYSVLVESMVYGDLKYNEMDDKKAGSSAQHRCGNLTLILLL